MSERYAPELGQGLFGGPWAELDSPDFLTPGLDLLGLAVADYRGNEDDNPCYNSGAKYENAVFALRAYCWCDGSRHNWDADELCPPNFEHFASGFQVRWYKHSHRGRSQNREITQGDWRQLVTECSNSIPAEPCEHDRVPTPHPWAEDNPSFNGYWECSRCGTSGFDQ